MAAGGSATAASAGVGGAAGAASSSPDVTQNEQRELHRVFEFLADFAPKHKLRKDLQPKLERKQKILSYKRNPDTVKIVDDTGTELPPEIIEKELQRLEEEIAEIQRRIDAIDAKSDYEKKIHPRDLQQALAYLGKHADKVRPRPTTRAARDRSPPHPAPAPAIAAPRRRRSRT